MKRIFLDSASTNLKNIFKNNLCLWKTRHPILQFFLIVILLFTLLIQPLQAQDRQFKDERRIFLWDVTLSMKGYNDAPNIYNEVVDALEKSINSVDDQNTELIVIPFQDKILDTWRATATENGKKELVKKIKKYKNDNVTYTNITLPMQQVMNKHIKSDKRNVLYLLTDGVQNAKGYPKESLINLIKSWCSFAEKNDAYAFYVMLTKYAQDTDLQKAIEDVCRMEGVSGNTNISFIELIPNEKTFFNLEKQSDAKLKFKSNNSNSPKGIQIKVESTNDPNFKVDEICTLDTNGQISIPVKLLKDKKTLKDSLSQTSNYTLSLHLSIVRDNTGKYKDVFLLEDFCTLEIVNHPEKLLEVYRKDKEELWGKTKFYNNFLFKKYKPVIMERDVEFVFNEDAKKYAKDVQFILYEKDSRNNLQKANDIKIYKNGTLCKTNILTISTKDSSIRLGIEFLPDAEKGQHKFYLKVTNNGELTRINETMVKDNPQPIVMKIRTIKRNICNPLLLGLLITLAVIVLALLIWLFILKPLYYPTFKVRNLYIMDDTLQKTIPLKGTHKVICTNVMQKQPKLKSIFSGKIVYVNNSFFNNGEVVVSPKDNRSVRIRFMGNYDMDESILSKSNSPLVMKHIHKDGTSIEFKI